jgi:haloalkane dehalogenase
VTAITETTPHSAFGDDVKAYDVPVLGSHIRTIEHGSGAPIVFIHGNPTSSFLWRHIFRRMAGGGYSQWIWSATGIPANLISNTR